jgi:hypothetical protein
MSGSIHPLYLCDFRTWAGKTLPFRTCFVGDASYLLWVKVISVQTMKLCGGVETEIQAF